MSERSIFLTALELTDADARAAYLDEACRGAPELRARIEALLAAAMTEGFMSRAATDRDSFSTLVSPAPRDDEPDRFSGTRLADRYVIGPRIGRGGMGTVYRALQEQPVRREVAIKLISPGMDSRPILARFEAERQALALMEHPGIARILDAGSTADGRPFFVMELVDGVPLTAYCDARRLTIADRLDLFRQICRAVQHAHQKGIIHRDLKPSNILVEEHDGRPTPKVIDFGLAKAVGEAALTERSLATVAGSLLGSPLYMAPEQAGPDAADVDVRADVYALGAILYELLTGSAPIDRGDLHRAALFEVMRRVREFDPPPPSRRLDESAALPSTAAVRGTEPARLRRLVRGDLDRVTLKALDKDRDRRYDSVSALAVDVERFLNHEPVSAGPPTLSYRLRKFVRRNRVAVVAASLIALALAGGAAGALWGLVRASTERDRAEEATARAYRALDTLTEDVLEGLLARRSDWSDRERAFLGRVRDQFELLAAAEGQGEAPRRMRAGARLRLGSIRSLFGDVKAAEDDYRAAVAEFVRLPSPSDRANAAQALRRLGGSLSTAGRAAEAQEAFREASSAYERLAIERPDDPAVRLGAALTRGDSGYVHYQAGEFAPAEADCRVAAEGLRTLAAEYPDDPNYPTDQGRVLHNLYTVLDRDGRHAEAELAIVQAVDILRAAHSRFPREPRVRLTLAKALESRYAVLARGDDLEKAAATLREVVAIAAALAAEYPGSPNYRRELARGRANLGLLYARMEQPAKALDALREAASTALHLVDEFPDVAGDRAQLAAIRISLGEEFTLAGRPAEGEAEFAAALPLWEALHGQTPVSPTYASGLAATLARLGAAAHARGDFPAARAFLDRAARVRDEDPELMRRDPMGPRAVEILASSLGPVLIELGDHAGAARAADELATVESPSAATLVYNAGCHLARCSSLAAEDANLTPERRKALAEEYAARAVAHLRKALALGFNDAALLASDTDLAPLRDRPDFKEATAGRP